MNDQTINPVFLQGLVKDLEDQRAFHATQSANKSGEIAVLRNRIADLEAKLLEQAKPEQQ